MDYGASKQPNNPLPEWILRLLGASGSKRSWIDLKSRGKFLKKLWCYVGGILQDNLVLSTGLIM